MADLNKIQLIGRIGQDPEMKYTQSGKEVVSLSLATSYKAGDNEKTTWHKLVFWGKRAELANSYLTKGSRLYVEGRLEIQKWQTKEGENKITPQVMVNEMIFLDNKKKSDNGGDYDSYDPSMDAPF